MNKFKEQWKKKHTSHVIEDREGRILDAYEDPDIEETLDQLAERNATENGIVKSFKQFWKSYSVEKSGLKIFTMTRQFDESGHSGVGKVLDGAVFPSGKTVVCWDPDNAIVTMQDGSNVNSIAVFDTFEAFHAIHIGQHPSNDTILTFLN